MPLSAAFGNFLIPLMWMHFPSSIVCLIRYFALRSRPLIRSGGGAWTAYPPAQRGSPLGASLWVTAVGLEFAAFLIGGINFVTTAMNARAPGMRAMDVPMVVWMICIASILFMASVGPLLAGAIMLLFDQNLGTAFFNPNEGGDPVLWQHLFWFFGHPEVYVVLLPACGIVADIITVFARKKLFAYKTILYTVIRH